MHGRGRARRPRGAVVGRAHRQPRPGERVKASQGTYSTTRPIWLRITPLLIAAWSPMKRQGSRTNGRWQGTRNVPLPVVDHVVARSDLEGRPCTSPSSHHRPPRTNNHGEPLRARRCATPPGARTFYATGISRVNDSRLGHAGFGGAKPAGIDRRSATNHFLPEAAAGESLEDTAPSGSAGSSQHAVARSRLYRRGWSGSVRTQKTTTPTLEASWSAHASGAGDCCFS